MSWTEGLGQSNHADEALFVLLEKLKQRGYQFVTPTPATHARVTARSVHRTGDCLRDVLGWSLPFDPCILDPELLSLLGAADALLKLPGGLVKSRYRVSSLGRELLLHSAYPTDAADAVFFGPDSYRFADLLRAELVDRHWQEGALLVDIGTGSGVGAIVAATLCPGLRVAMTDINVQALRLAKINAAVSGIKAQCVHGANLDGIDGPVTIAIANPPYIIDHTGRQYRDGGTMHGGRASYDMAAATVKTLAPGGRFILYTGSAIIGGGDPLRDALFEMAVQHGCTIRYRELDPDVFGEELDRPDYREVERIALVGAVLSRPD